MVRLPAGSWHGLGGGGEPENVYISEVLLHAEGCYTCLANIVPTFHNALGTEHVRSFLTLKDVAVFLISAFENALSD